MAKPTIKLTEPNPTQLVFSALQQVRSYSVVNVKHLVCQSSLYTSVRRVFFYLCNGSEVIVIGKAIFATTEGDHVVLFSQRLSCSVPSAVSSPVSRIVRSRVLPVSFFSSPMSFFCLHDPIALKLCSLSPCFYRHDPEVPSAPSGLIECNLRVRFH